MVLGGVMYALFVSSFFALKESLLYTGSALLGAGNAILWISQVLICVLFKNASNGIFRQCLKKKLFFFQGAFLSLNSDPDTIARNSGAFYSFLMLSGLVGNTFTYFQFKDSYEIHPEDQVGVILFLLPIKKLCV